MFLIPKSLLTRTVLIILLALAATQAVSFWLFNRLYSQPRQQIALAGFTSHLKSISAALETIPPERHLEFIGRLQEREGIRIGRVKTEQGESEREVELAPDTPGLRGVRARLKREYGEDADVYLRPQNPNLFLIKLPVGERQYWVVFPRNRIERDAGMAWLGWAVFGATIALLAAFLLMRKVSQPLRELATSARLLGKGGTPRPVAIEGPSEVRAVAAAFNQMQDDLARQAKERATFLAGVSHDLRTPLARMRLNIEMLGDKVDGASRNGMASDIEDMDAIIGQFLDFAREESGELSVRQSLNALIEDVLGKRSDTANIRKALTPLPDLPLRPVAARRMIANLLDNAAKYGGGQIEVETAQSGNAVLLCVKDRGPGIPADQVERLKQPFTRLDEARGGASGSGLGLAIVERIARLHGGRLDLLPRNGGGLEARVTLPLSG
ncbi:MAG: HAMP domain-containing protein [Betaproteobacteria bacterium]|nr:HAMP domain-containing protein [Betaproteobacteria bacterium]